MTVMQQSSKAEDRTLGVWFQNIQQGLVKLPRFQRFEAWDRGRITSFLNTVINNLPVGVTLALDVGAQEKFVSRYIATAEPAGPAGIPRQHLLDGQQRLTAFWRAAHNNYESETYFVFLPTLKCEEAVNGTDIQIWCLARWRNKKGDRMPIWANDPEKCLKRGLIPFSLLRPGDMSAPIDEWLNQAVKPVEPSGNDPSELPKYITYTNALKRIAEIKALINPLRERVAHFNLPFLSLPADTEKDIALQVFINMNTNSKPLSMYDIIVAEVENVTGQSLHDMEANLKGKCPAVGRYGDTSQLILSVSALLQEKPPSMRGMLEMDKSELLGNWPRLERGLARMAAFMEGQKVFDEARLPTNAVLAVIAAAYDGIPEHGDFLGKVERLFRRYLWSSFFTDRYENAASTRAFADFKALKTLLQNEGFTDRDLSTVPVLDRTEYPLADADSLMTAGWPKAEGIEARAILAVTTYLGAIDFADHQIATYDSIQKREYHHIFPDALLSEAGMQPYQIYRALNCALITWKTNRIIGRKDPLDYLKERVEMADEVVVRERLRSHLIAFDLLSNAHYANLDEATFKEKVAKDFNEFIRDRAELVIMAMKMLTEGNSPSVAGLWADRDREVALKAALADTLA